MPYRILLTRQVEKQLDTLPRQTASRIEQCIEALHINPRPPGVKKIRRQTGIYRVRVGNWRIMYTINDNTQEITLLTLDARKDIYR